MAIHSTVRLPAIRLLLFAFFAAVTCVAARAATIVVVNQDGPNEGFNDPTAVSPVGGNSGTTLGQQRLVVFQEAARIWGDLLPSNVQIRVDATFDPLTCDASSGVLGSAGPLTIASDFPGAEFPNTWYHIALANKLHGSDLDLSSSDIVAHFNSSVDDPTCLGATSWYYGLDHAHGANLDLLRVVAHELAHGLGFSTFTDLTNGSVLIGKPDVFSRFILDTDTGLHWNQMTNEQRAASAVNTGHVAWDGDSVTAQAPNYLGRRGVVRVNSPPALAGPLEFGDASFGPQLSSPGVTADLVLVDDGVAPTSDACSPLVNGATVSGKIALIDRGGCTFVSKAQQAEASGAIAVVVVNNVAGPPPFMSGDGPDIGIPLVSITQSDGANIKAQLGSGVNMTLGLDVAHLAGANDSGQVLLYAPDPLELGSSISHWDVSATPDLLMEPFLTATTTSGVDLTLFVFKELGWDTTGTTGTLLALFQARPVETGIEIRWRLREPVRSTQVLLERSDRAAGPWIRIDAARAREGDVVMVTDRTAESGRAYLYRLNVVTPDGQSAVFGPLTVIAGLPIADLDLGEVMPNPTTGEARVDFTVPHEANIELAVVDLLGRNVATLAAGRYRAGRHQVVWSGTVHGRRAPAGLYFVRYAVPGQALVRRVVLIR